MLSTLTLLSILIVPMVLSTSVAYATGKRHNRKLTEQRLLEFCQAEKPLKHGVFLESRILSL